MKKLVCNVETATKLIFPRGFESEFSWYCRDKGVWGWEVLTTKLAKWAKNQFEIELCQSRRQFVNKDIAKTVNDKIGLLPAPLLTEMLDLLPDVIYIGKIPHYLNLRQKDYEKEINYIKYPHGLHGNFESETFTFAFDVDNRSSYHNGNEVYKHICINAATAAAKLYMWLMDKGYINPSPHSDTAPTSTPRRS